MGSGCVLLRDNVGLLPEGVDGGIVEELEATDSARDRASSGKGFISCPDLAAAEVPKIDAASKPEVLETVLNSATSTPCQVSLPSKDEPVSVSIL